VYLGNVIGGGELNIDPTMSSLNGIWKLVPHKLGVLSRIPNILRNFIALFLVVVATLHAITTIGKVF
jgi:hypothetical protein